MKDYMDKKDNASKHVLKLSIEIFIVAITIFVGVFSDLIFNEGEAKLILSRTLGKFFNLGNLVTNNYIRIIETITVFLFVWVLNKLAIWAFKLFVSKKKQNTAGNLLILSFVKYFLIFIGLIFILAAWGVESSTLLVSLGLIGLVVSFSAQGLIEDMISGIFIIIEKQYEVGDIINLDGFRGQVIEINLRTTKFLDPSNNDIKFITNSQIKSVINLSKKSSLASCLMSIEYSADLKKIESICTAFLPSLKEKYEEIIDVPFYMGVSELSDSAVILRFGSFCDEKNKFKVQRILNREMKLLFDENNITIPFPQVVVHKE
jgi:small conductance mechanosensitive channel